MEGLDILPTRTTPAVGYDPATATLRLSGQSYPENAFAFFAVIMDWLSAHLSTRPQTLRVEFRLDYFNTSSSKCLLDLLESLEVHHQVNGGVEVIWYHEPDDEDMEDSGHDFGEDLALPFNVCPLESASQPPGSTSQPPGSTRN